MKYLLSLGLLAFFFGLVQPAIAQEEEDPYADYSYLWDDDKKKKKDKKKKRKSEPQTTTDLQDENYPVDTIPPKGPIDEPEQPLMEEPEEELAEGEKEKKVKESGDLPPVKDFRAGLPSGQNQSSVTGGFTLTQIDGQYYAGLILAPELSLGKVGLGLHIPILYGIENQSFRTEIFEGGVGIARLIRYLRLGNQKQDPIYLRIGELNNTMIGYGGLINNYTNTTSYEKRKLGIHYDLNFRGLVGIEGMYSDFNPVSLNLLAVRPYVRPLARSGIPIINTFEVGGQYVIDRDQTPIPVNDSTSVTYQLTKDGVSAYGFDAGITLLSIPFIQIDLFTTYSIIEANIPVTTTSTSGGTYAAKSFFYEQNNIDVGDDPVTTTSTNSTSISGSGFSAGLNFRLNFIADLFNTDIRIERLNYTENYLPQFFDATYEINKDAKILSLASAPSMSGTYGSLQGHILQKVKLGGSLMIPDNISETSPGVVRLNADLERLADKISMHASYIKGNLSTLQDAFTFDENSLAKVRFIYHMNRFLAAGVDYYWAFAPTEDGSYKATNYVSPYFGLSIAF